MTIEQSTVDDWVPLVRAEYLDMPGLNLTKPQVQRLWMLRADECDALLEVLVGADFLTRTNEESYVLADRFQPL